MSSWFQFSIYARNTGSRVRSPHSIRFIHETKMYRYHVCVFSVSNLDVNLIYQVCCHPRNPRRSHCKSLLSSNWSQNTSCFHFSSSFHLFLTGRSCPPSISAASTTAATFYFRFPNMEKHTIIKSNCFELINSKTKMHVADVMTAV